ncbi:amine oxidase [Penicillium capsulatum]|uniref:Amine oxidase n=1 Tax=Penicillium capsulatum TaxID=69766 RepID=A0A9W9IQV8_9EURO|nr:amine oxidase [Penicillium capsulatum]KAJ6129862.1 amine oxidase [Penicillium capsulatum]
MTTSSLILVASTFNTIIRGEADTFLRKMILTTEISYSDEGVEIHNKDGSCIQASYIICTFSLGVLQNNAVKFTLALSEWKQTTIHKFTIGTYTKSFMQFDETFWPKDIYTDPLQRGWYSVFQSLSMPEFLPESNILFVTATSELAWRAERQPNAQTRSEVLAVLRKTFPNVTIPEPTGFLYPWWSTEPGLTGAIRTGPCRRRWICTRICA